MNAQGIVLNELRTCICRHASEAVNDIIRIIADNKQLAGARPYETRLAHSDPK